MERNTLNSFGKFCRILRINNSEILMDMAKKLNVTVSYLSAVENGKRDIPERFVEQIPLIYKLKGDELKKFYEAVDESRKKISINIDDLSATGKRTMIKLAKKIEHDSDVKNDELLDKILELVNLYEKMGSE